MSRTVCRRLIARVLVPGWLTFTALAVVAGPAAPEPILPESQHWGGPPGNPHLKGAWMLGSETEPGPYALRVSLLQGGRIAPHTHPDTRYTTVLSGTLYVGFGEREDDARLVAVPAGGIYVAPQGVPHYVYAKDGDVVYQESGVGPTANIPVSN